MQDIPVKLVVRVLDRLEYEGKHSLMFAFEYGPNQIGCGEVPHAFGDLLIFRVLEKPYSQDARVDQTSEQRRQRHEFVVLEAKDYGIMQFACQQCLVQRAHRTLVLLRNLGNRQRGNSRVTLPPALLTGR
jgi:hypothetical protein